MEDAEKLIKSDTCFNLSLPILYLFMQIILGNPYSDKDLQNYVKCCSDVSVTIFFQHRKIIHNQKNLTFSWATVFRMLIIING